MLQSERRNRAGPENREASVVNLKSPGEEESRD